MKNYTISESLVKELCKDENVKAILKKEIYLKDDHKPNIIEDLENLLKKYKDEFSR